MESYVLNHPWIPTLAWCVLYVGDYYLTILGAKLCRKQTISEVEGSYEMTPAYQADVDSLTLFSPTLFRNLLIYAVVLLAAGTYLVALELPAAYGVLVGYVVFIEFGIYARHIGNITFYGRLAGPEPGARGHIVWTNRGLYLHSSVQLACWSGFTLVAAALTKSPVLFGAAAGFADHAYHDFRTARSHSQQDQQSGNKADEDSPEHADPNKQRFDAAAKTWDELPRRVQLAEAVVKAILGRVPVTSEMEAMDYGCGTGLVTLLLAPRVRSMLGADISEGMLSVLRDKIASLGIANVDTVTLDLQRDPPLDRRFDLIASSMTMHHVRNPAQIIGKLVTMLKPGGWLCVADLDVDGGDFHTDKTGVEHFGFDRDHVGRILEQAGLESVTLDTAHVIAREIERVMREFPVFLACGCAPADHPLQ